ncbi:COP-coated vesicle membrane protein p24 precursor [Trypanosoma rangeli]|uniref:COP-coated vesicle membrane protein p24 n=1 Tax=Trypanosoma rangeli TaxID=5698 RepID=A0A422NB76_TRYRA|nr:COP-coated vesicle membrane protein p24 precursor [Trypanosoma rangeli]RNF02730.1 COP-coated vesicle membrane protein p24 precursor [Trypanosoma rangeli]|eukprot:RNF02730.1 COP-coated vesicle membrane protein p24 precursor [Trypanosoma rangeli]
MTGTPQLALPMWRVPGICLLLLLLSCAMAPAFADDGAVSILVPANRDECFLEDITGIGVKVFLHYMVTSGGSLDIDATIYGPDNSHIWESVREAEARVLFKTRTPGRHRFCFSNKMSTITNKVVAFSIAVGESGMDTNKDQMAKAVDPLERSIMRIQQGLREVQEVQRYLRGRERIHRATTEVANTRVVIWSAVEVLIIAFMGACNVWYLKRIFNKRRVV